MEFTTSFQLRLLILFFIDKEWFLQNKEYVKPEYFNSLWFQWLFNLLERHFSQYKTLPTRTVVEEEFRKDDQLVILPEEEQLVTEFLALLTAGFLPDDKYIKDSFRTFARSQTINAVLTEHADEARKSGDFDLLTSNLRREAKQFDLQEGTVPEAEGKTFSIFNIEEIYKNRGGIKSGIGLIDNVIGGLMTKEESLILGDTNVGKSLLAQFIGANVVKQHQKVCHVGLEMSRARNLIRYYTSLAEDEDGITYGQLFNCSPFDKVVDYVETTLHERYEGMLFVEELPENTCTLEHLYRFIDKYDGIKFLIVDYLDLMKPPRKRDALRHELSDLATGLRALAKEANIHVMSPTQASKLASNRRIPGKEHTAEDYGKMRIADWAIAIGQNQTDTAKHEVVLSIARSRNSEKHFAERYIIDFNRMRFKYIQQEMIGQKQE